MSTTLLRRLACIAAGLMVLAIITTPAAAADPAHKLDAALEARSHQMSGRSQVIVQFTGDPDVRAITDARGSVGRRLAGIHAQVAELDNAALNRLASDPRVAHVSLDRVAFATLERTGGAVGASLARDEFGLSGRGIGVAVIDSGITSWHDDLYVGYGVSAANRVVHFKDFTTTVATSHPDDPYGHGTHVAGIIAGNVYDSGGRRTGIAPDANLIGLKVLDRFGNGCISNVIAALDYAVSIKSAYNIRVINLSIGSAITESYKTDPLTLAARRAVDAGIVVLAAAGNIGRAPNGQTIFGGITSPGNAPWVLTVGATSHQGTVARSDDTIAGFSSRGPTWIDFSAKPDLVAPGVGIESLSDPYSTLYGKNPALRLDGTLSSWYRPYMSLSGTSMATPVVSGTVALMLEANPRLTPNAVKAILEYTAQARTGQSPLAQGAGLLNAHGALRLARFFAAPQSDPGTPGDRIAGEWIGWSRQFIWGNYLVTGGVPTPQSNAWTTGTTWGTLRTVTGAPIVWGQSDDDANIVWSTGGADDENIVWSTGDDENIVWSTSDDDSNIVWSTATVQNVVWGRDCGGRNCDRVTWGASDGHGGVWGTASDDQNIVWSTSDDENIVWSTSDDDSNIVWSTGARVDQVVWGAPVTDNRRRSAAATK
jgi:serine protease AprX